MSDNEARRVGMPAVLAMGYALGPATKKTKKPKGRSLIQKIFAKRGLIKCGLIKCSFEPLKHQLDIYQIAADQIYGRQSIKPS